MESVVKVEFPDPLKLEHPNSDSFEPPVKRQRTSEDFFTFCQFILEYENYEAMKQEELRQKNSASPMGSTAESFLSDSNSNSSSVSQDAELKTSTDNDSEEEDNDSWDLITCYCMKPFAGRPMIECSECTTWVHLSCAKVRRNNIPDEFICQMCKEAKVLTRRSQRNKAESRRIIVQ